MWQFLQPAPFPAAQHLGGQDVPDPQLRAMGERTAKRYIGYHNMGLATVPKARKTAGHTPAPKLHSRLFAWTPR
jgi:hypothetical protein